MSRTRTVRPAMYPKELRLLKYPASWEHYADNLNEYIDYLEHQIITINNNEDVKQLKYNILK